jgi:hypothetical protein
MEIIDAMSIRKLNLRGICASIAMLISSCVYAGDKYVGSWYTNYSAVRNDDELIEITANEASYLVSFPLSGRRLAFISDKGVLHLPGGLGRIALVHQKSDDTLQCVGCGGAKVYVRTRLNFEEMRKVMQYAYRTMSILTLPAARGLRLT